MAEAGDSSTKCQQVPDTATATIGSEGESVSQKDDADDARQEGGDSTTPSEATETAGMKGEGVESYWPLNAENLLAFPRCDQILKEYFMGGMERYLTVLNFLKSLQNLNAVAGDIASPAVQFRVLTRGHASSTNSFLNMTGLKEQGRYIHSVWDTQGSGFDANDKSITFDESTCGDNPNKLDMINVFASEIEATRILFAEDMRGHDKAQYEAWIDEKREKAKSAGAQFDCEMIALPYEARGLSAQQLDDILEWVSAQQAEGHVTMVVFDFDCTMTSRHFFKSLYWLRDRYHMQFLKWLPTSYFDDPKTKDEIMDRIDQHE